MADQDKQARGITAIEVKGFKSLRDETRIAIRPLTVLAGANSSGKSSIMQPLLLLKQTLDAPYDPGALLLDGANVKFSDPRDFLHVGADIQQFSITIESSELAYITATYSPTSENHMEVTENIYGSQDRSIRVTSNMTNEEIAHQFGLDLEQLQKALQGVSKANFEWRVTRNRCFLGPSLISVDENGNTEDTGFGGLSFKDFSLNLFRNAIQNIIHLSGFRGNPQREYPRTPVVSPPFSGTFDYYVASVIEAWFRSKAGSSSIEKLVDNLYLLKLADTIETVPSSTSVQIRINRTPVDAPSPREIDELVETVNIADVGFGVSQVLPVLVALLVAEPGQLVYIEQPELHLHPRAQVALAQILADAANRGVRVVIETHSDLVLLGIQTLVAEKTLSPNDVILHWFERDKEGCTKVTSTDLDEFGRMEMSDFPEDFGTVRFEAQGRFLDAVDITEADMESGD